MLKPFKNAIAAGMVVGLSGCAAQNDVEESQSEEIQSALQGAAVNLAGVAQTLHTSGSIDRSNPFFQQLGTNPRSCETCHAAAQGWTISALGVTLSFLESDGLAPLFNLVDEGKRPDADVSTREARLDTFKETLLKRGLTRFTRTVPAAAEFTLTAVVDPYGWSDTTRYSGFRRPTPTANESKASTTNWTNAADPLTQVRGVLVGGARLHEQRDPANPVPTTMAVAAGDFMFGVIFAQALDWQAGRLDSDGAKGGPANLMAQPFYLGINDVGGNDPMGKPFNPKVFDIYDAWAKYQGNHWDFRAAARASIYRGQEIFNVRGKCSGCHNTPNVGGHSVVRFFDIGTAVPPKCDPVLPLLTVQNNSTGETRVLCDLGRAQSTGKWADLGRFRAPPLRGLAARAPYFHDGQARDLGDVIGHYDERLSLGLTGAEKRDLEAFLRAL
jgi:cytochrome c peroxidase